MRTAALFAGLLTLATCRKREAPPAPEPGEPGQGYEAEAEQRGGETIPRFVTAPPPDLPPQPPEVVVGPCSGKDAAAAAAAPATLTEGAATLLACYQQERSLSPARVTLALVVGGDGKPAHVTATGVPSALGGCLGHAVGALRLAAPLTPDVALTCELALLPERGLAHQPLASAPLLRLTDALRQDGHPAPATLPPGLVLLEPDPETRVHAVADALASPALAGHPVGFVVTRGGRRYQLAALPGRAPEGPGPLLWVARDSFWLGSAADHRQIRNQEPAAYDFAALTATLAKLRGDRLDVAIAADDDVRYDTLARTIEAALAAGLVDFRVVPRAQVAPAFTR